MEKDIYEKAHDIRQKLACIEELKVMADSNIDNLMAKLKSHGIIEPNNRLDPTRNTVYYYLNLKREELEKEFAKL
jgi:hypothetical protein